MRLPTFPFSTLSFRVAARSSYFIRCTLVSVAVVRGPETVGRLCTTRFAAVAIWSSLFSKKNCAKKRLRTLQDDSFIPSKFIPHQLCAFAHLHSHLHICVDTGRHMLTYQRKQRHGEEVPFTWDSACTWWFCRISGFSDWRGSPEWEPRVEAREDSSAPKSPLHVTYGSPKKARPSQEPWKGGMGQSS